MAEQKIHIARIILEAGTPLYVGSGKSSLLKDALVQRDANGFPMIPGTTLAGVIRHALSDEDENLAIKLMGTGKKRKKNKPENGEMEDPGHGSCVKISPGMMLLEKNKVSESLIMDDQYAELQSKFENLPIRQHVAIDDKGVSKKGQLYDHEVIYKGVQFVFELEARSNLISSEEWTNLLSKVKSNSFRLGAGTRNGFGLLKPIKSFQKTMSVQEYLKFSPSFNDPKWWEEVHKIKPEQLSVADNVITYTLELKPDPFFIFGSGLSDDDVDQTPVTEKVVTYEDGTLKLSEAPQTLIPGSSVKGAIAHRVAYYFNKKNDRFASSETEIKKWRESENEAVSILFGSSGENDGKPEAGNVFFKDVFLKPEEVNNEEILNHVAIDRFTGGAMDGMLFSEKVSHFRDQEETLVLEVQLRKKAETEKYQDHLKEALEDICRGLLPLGGMNTKGHGIFTGILKKRENNQEEKIFNYNDNGQ